MSVQELKERYVYAVSRLLPHKMRSDISAELDTLIEGELFECLRWLYVDSGDRQRL